MGSFLGHWGRVWMCPPGSGEQPGSQACGRKKVEKPAVPAEPEKTEAELEAESYVLGDHWWTERANLNEGAKRAENKDAWLSRLLPKRDHEPRSAVSQNKIKTAQELHDVLKNSPGHGQYFWLQKVYGNAASKNIVLIVPQYHRATGLPVLWSSLGEEVATVQGNLQYLIEDLVVSENLSCLGIEGSSANRVRRSVGLDKAVSWAQRLHSLFQGILYEAALEDPRLVPAAHTILEGLKPYFARYVRWQDGVGAAVARLGPEAANLNRFGLEDDILVREAESLHMKLLDLKKKMMVNTKADKGELAIRDMWIAEYPDFFATVSYCRWRKALVSCVGL